MDPPHTPPQFPRHPIFDPLRERGSSGNSPGWVAHEMIMLGGKCVHSRFHLGIGQCWTIISLRQLWDEPGGWAWEKYVKRVGSWSWLIDSEIGDNLLDSLFNENPVKGIHENFTVWSSWTRAIHGQLLEGRDMANSCQKCLLNTQDVSFLQRICTVDVQQHHLDLLGRILLPM